MRYCDTRGVGVIAMGPSGTFLRNYFLAVAVFIGFASAIGQVLLIRELLTVFRGNEFIIGMIFTGWFLGIFAGARINPQADDRILERRIMLSYLLFPVVLLALVYLAHMIPVFVSRTTGSFFSLTTEFFLSFAFTVPVSFFVGFFFPPIITLLSRSYREKSGGVVYLVESLGAFAGGMLFSFLLIDILNPAGIGAILILLSLGLFIARYGKKRLIPLLALPVLLLWHSEGLERELFKFVWNRTQSSTLIRYDRTRHQTILLGFNEQQISVYGDGILYYTIPDRYETRQIFHLIQSLRNGTTKDDILIFGAGPGSLPYNLLRTDISSLAYFEIDPKLYRTIEPYRIRFYRTGPEDNRLSVISQDLRYYLQNTENRYDMIVCFPPVPHNANLNRFYTSEFYAMCRDRLKEGGIFLTSLGGFSSSMEGEQKEFISSIYRSFTANFPLHMRTSGDPIYLIGARSPGALPVSPEKLIAGYGKRLLEMRKLPLENAVMENFSPRELKSFFEPTHIKYFDETVGKGAPGAVENRDRMPYAYWNYILYSAARDRSLLYSVLKEYRYFLALLVVVTALVLFRVKRKHGAEQFAGSLVIYAVGMVSMSAVLLMIMLYQNFYGVVYYRISLINALFMLGLTAGSWLANRYSLRSLTGVMGALLGVLLLLCAYTFLRHEGLFWAILFLFSLLSGTAFPSLFMTLSKDNYHVTASNLDSMEFFGSIIGSVATTAFLPVMGLQVVLGANMAIVGAAMFVAYYLRVITKTGFSRPPSAGGKS